MFTDTPGIINKVEDLMSKTINNEAPKAIGRKDIVVCLVDISRPKSEEENKVIGLVRKQPCKKILVYNKMDKAGNDLKQTDKNNAMSNQGKAKESLDNAAKMLGDMLDKMGKQQGKGNKGDGKMGQLMQKLAELIA